MLELDPKTTALVLIDLQKGIMGRELSPRSADRVTKAGSTLADTFRKAGAPVVLVNVGFAKDFKDALRQPVDQPLAYRGSQETEALLLRLIRAGYGLEPKLWRDEQGHPTSNFADFAFARCIKGDPF